jgi:hypothetical protein
LVPLQLHAQTYISFENPSFELPGTTKQKGWDNAGADDVPGWTSDAPVVDSGVEPDAAATDGAWRGFQMGGDTLVYQVTEHVIVEGDDIELLVDAKNSWAATLFEMGIFSEDTLGVKVTLEKIQVTLTDVWATYSLKFKASDHPDALGKKLGVAFDNVSIAQSWINFDNVRAINLNPSIEVVNFSFEQPGIEKIKGWDGPGTCIDPGWTGLTDDIPGWTSDAPVWDSGVESGHNPTDGTWTAFAMGHDTSFYQITNHLIENGDVIEMLVDAYITWNATMLEAAIFYVDTDSVKVPLETEQFEITSDMTEYSLVFSAAGAPNSIGKKLGISFDNVSDSASWVGLDNVRLINSKEVAVNEKQTKLTGYALDQNYPNPFNPETAIHYRLPSAGTVQLEIYDILGHKVRTLVDKQMQSGSQSIRWNGTDESGKNVPSGVYVYRIKLMTSGNTFTDSKKMLLMK